MAALQRELARIQQETVPPTLATLTQQVNDHYAKARAAFEQALQRSNGQDLESDVFIAVTYSVVFKVEAQRAALDRLEQILDGRYAPRTTRERITCFYAQTLRDAARYQLGLQ